MTKEENVKNSSEKNMKIAVTIIIVLVVLLAGTIFALQQNKNKEEPKANENTQQAQEMPATTNGNTNSGEDAGAIGKNEIKLTDANFKAEVLDYQGVVLVDFYASWCPHCKNIAADVTAVSDALVGKAKVGKLDVDESPETAKKYEVRGTPTFIVFKNGQEVEKVSGERKKDFLMDLVNKYLK